ncbi:MAG: leucine-rich repeat domain-containing protein, partial [Anaerolineae bacterium]
MQPFEPTSQPASDNRLLRLGVAVVAGLAAASTIVAIFFFIGRLIFAYLTRAISFESGGIIGLLVDVVCVAPLGLAATIVAGLVAGRFVSGRLATIAAGRGAQAQRRAGCGIVAGIGAAVALVIAFALVSRALPTVPTSERVALAKMGIGHSGESLCDRRDIDCEGNAFRAHVTEIRTRYPVDRIPPEIAGLQYLTVLDVSGNDIESIPPEIGGLARLQTLDVSHARLSHIPPEVGNLAALETLRLDYNQITAIPPELGKLANLQSLSLNDNQLAGPIPPELGDLRSLQSLHLENNQLTGSIPPEFGQLVELRELYVSKNGLAG